MINNQCISGKIHT